MDENEISKSPAKSDDFFEKRKYVYKVETIRGSCRDYGIDLPSQDEVADTSLIILKEYYESIIKKIYAQEEKQKEQQYKIMVERTLEMYDAKFERIDQNKQLFDKVGLELSIPELLKLHPGQLVYELCGVSSKEKYLLDGFVDKLNNIIYLMIKFQLTLMEKDGYITINEVIKSDNFSKYLEIKNVLTKYIILCSYPRECAKYSKGKYKHILEHKCIIEFREYSIDEIFSGLSFSPDDYYGFDTSKCQIL